MQALAQALMAEMGDFKVAVFETLAAAARWPSLKGQVAGSGVLGVVTATLLAPRHPPAVKALMVRLCAVLSVDSPECVQMRDPKREEEFAKLRGQLLSSGAVEAIAGMLGPGSAPALRAAAAGALATFAGVGSDSPTRAALAKASVTAQLLACVPGSAKEAEGSSRPSRSSEGLEATGQGAAPDEAHVTDNGTNDSPEVAATSTGESENDEDEDYILTQVLSALAVMAQAEGDGADAILEPLREPDTLSRLRALIADDGGGCQVSREVVEQTLACLSALGRHANIWPVVDESLSSDLARLITCNSEQARYLLGTLIPDRARTVQLGDLRPLRRAVRHKQINALIKALEAIPGCEQCGKASEKSLLACTGCRKVEYCSRDCQKAAWKMHKAVCEGAKK